MKTLASLGCVALAGLVIVGCSTPTNDEVDSSSHDLVAPLDMTDPTDPLPPEDPHEAAVSAPTCAPSLATGAVVAKHRAMLDTIAYTEGTAGSCGQDGYNTGFSYKCFTSCVRHPNIAWHAGSYTSTAAGRYQFLNRTWNALGLGPFSPKNQDIGAMKLISRRGVNLPTTRALTATEFSNAMKKISYEWASLPFSPYGQPTVNLTRTRAKYCSFAGC
jgi:muramidase (phage lysozyme)